MRLLSRAFLLFSLFPGVGLRAQPVMSDGQTAAGLHIYPDYQQKGLYYYAPGNLKLATMPDGRPVFQLLAMRYTGTACRADQGEAHFTNGVQFSVRMENINAATVEAAKQQLGLDRTAKLRPMPIRNLQSFLVTPTGTSNEGRLQYERIGEGALQGAGQGGETTQNTFWTERTFNLKLDKYEAQLLWDQVEKGRLAISFGYAFYAEVIPGGPPTLLAGSRELLEQFKELESAGPDTLLTTRVVHANAFSFEVDIKRWPDLAKKVDLNEGTPPDYAALEVRCYDFTHGLRPDLALKQVEISATAVNGRPVSVQARFSQSQADQPMRSIYFPFAVRMDRPMQYRIIETRQDGTRTTSEWLPVDPCQGLIDVTTPVDQNKIGTFRLEVETDAGLLSAAELDRVSFRVFYFLNDKIREQEIVLSSGDVLPLKALHFVYDKEKPVVYQLNWIHRNGEEQTTPSRTLEHDYYFLRGPQE